MTQARPTLLMLGRLIVDDLQYVDGRVASAVPGGAGLHAAAGAALWWPYVAPVCGTGHDVHDATERLLIADNYVTDGLITRGSRCVRSRLDYLPDGGRTETSVYGSAHFDSMALAPSEIPPVLLPAAGTYVFDGAAPSFWSEIQALRPQLGLLLWEFLADAAVPDRLADITDALSCADIVSLNLAEAQTLFGALTPHQAIDRLLEMGAAVVVLRMGADGSLAAHLGRRLHVRPPDLQVADETGAGNSFCGGFLAGWCLRPNDLEHALRCAVAAASCTLERVGPARATDRANARLFAQSATIESPTERPA